MIDTLDSIFYVITIDNIERLCMFIHISQRIQQILEYKIVVYNSNSKIYHSFVFVLQNASKCDMMFI